MVADAFEELATAAAVAAAAALAGCCGMLRRLGIVMSSPGNSEAGGPLAVVGCNVSRQ